MLIFSLLPGRSALSAVGNPMLGETEKGSFTRTKDDIVNILLLGIDYGYEYSTLVSYKGELEDCHTDAVVVVALNRTQKTLDLISLPRDTVSYAPGVQGMYKLNGIINCADSIEKGIEAVCQSVSWHLGGVKMDHYIAVDVPALIALGDAIGGVEYDLEMSYTATSGYYEKGLQVLDGQGIMDYMRARKNAPVGGTDLGRTERQRKMLSAIFQKIKSKPSLVFKCIGVLFDDSVSILTDIGFFDVISLGFAALRMDLSTMETHVLDGKLQGFYSNFNFTDPDARSSLLKDVYGIEVEGYHSVSNNHMRWLSNEGFQAAKHINLAEKILTETKKNGLTKEQKEARKALEAAHDEAIAAFDAAAAHQGGDERNALARASSALKREIEAAAAILEYQEKLVMKVADPFYEDDLINEYQLNWN